VVRITGMVLAGLLLWPVANEARADVIRVAVAGDAPFVISQNGVWSGLSVDIWQKVAALNEWEYEFTGYPDETSAVKALLAGSADIVVAEVPITSEILQYVEFSQPYFRSGLQVMVTSARPHTLKRLFQDLNSFGHLTILWWLVGLVVVLTALVTLFERRHNPDFPKAWHDGVAEAFYFVISLLVGKSSYKGFPGVLGRLMLVFWMLVGLLTVMYLTSSITAVMTMEKMQSAIAGPQDLPGKLVGAVKNGKAVSYLSRNRIETNLYPKLEDAVGALVNGDVRAVVGAAPILQYYDANHPELPITEVGHVFSPYNYGFALPMGSKLRQPLNSALLRLQESGTIFDLAQKYFGTVYQP